MQAQKQFLRYATVGLATNVMAYLIYLALTGLGLGHKLTMSLVYGISVLQTFVLNKQWSFGFAGATREALTRYLIAYACGYIVNFAALWLLVDLVGWPHAWVQAVMVGVVAVLLFAAQRYWVFPTANQATKP